VSTERPILFSDAMVRAILSGAKTQTRRLVNPQPPKHISQWLGWCDDGSAALGGPTGDFIGTSRRNPYGKPGDRLYVREAWRTWERPEDCLDGIRFRADDSFRPIESSREAADRWVDAHNNGIHGDRWRPSIHMPRWASRLTLEVTGVWVEQIQDITEADILAEGVTVDVAAKLTGIPWSSLPTLHHGWQAVWDHINADRAPWASNPWVWRVSFRRLA
jgi:hypothetical protein